MDEALSSALGWLTIAMPITFGIAVLGAAVWVLAKPRPLEQRYPVRGGGLGGAFDSVFAPSAMEAASEVDRQTRRTAPAPTPGDPPWGIDGNRIRLDL